MASFRIKTFREFNYFHNKNHIRLPTSLYISYIRTTYIYKFINTELFARIFTRAKKNFAGEKCSRIFCVSEWSENSFIYLNYAF